MPWATLRIPSALLLPCVVALVWATYLVLRATSAPECKCSAVGDTTLDLGRKEQPTRLLLDRIAELTAEVATLRQSHPPLQQVTLSIPPPPLSAEASFTARHCGPFSLPVYHHTSRRPLHLVFLTNPVPFSSGGQISETLWLRDVVLHKLQRPVVLHYPPEAQKHDFFLSDSLIVALFLKRSLWIQRARDKGHDNLGIYDMGDEKLAHPTDYIPKFDFVLRNYYSRNLEERFPNLHWIPQGSKSGLGNHLAFIPSTLALASQRPHLCNFLGSMRANRAAVLRVLEDHHIRCTTNVNRWEGKGARDPILYRFTLETSQFTLCPWGNNPETMRMYEAMECGSIPILQRWPRPEEDPLTALGPDHPLPVVDEWSQLPALLQRYADPTELDVLQARVIRWWIRRKDAFMTLTRNVIDDSFAKKYGASERVPLQPCTQ